MQRACIASLGKLARAYQRLAGSDRAALQAQCQRQDLLCHPVRQWTHADLHPEMTGGVPEANALPLWNLAASPSLQHGPASAISLIILATCSCCPD